MHRDNDAIVCRIESTWPLKRRHICTIKLALLHPFPKPRGRVNLVTIDGDGHIDGHFRELEVYYAFCVAKVGSLQLYYHIHLHMYMADQVDYNILTFHNL